jgi:hypothetical protein
VDRRISAALTEAHVAANAEWQPRFDELRADLDRSDDARRASDAVVGRLSTDLIALRERVSWLESRAAGDARAGSTGDS